jgi:hypothetical protein
MQASTAGGNLVITVFGVFSQGGSCVDGATCAGAAEGRFAGEGHTAGGAVASVFSQCPLKTAAEPRKGSANGKVILNAPPENSTQTESESP